MSLHINTFVIVYLYNICNTSSKISKLNVVYKMIACSIYISAGCVMLYELFVVKNIMSLQLIERLDLYF